MVTTEASLTTSVIDAKQNREIITLDILNTFVQTPAPKSNKRIIMRITGLLVDYLKNLFPTEYKKYVAMQNQTKILDVEMKKALYGMMLPSLLFYKHFKRDLESIEFKINPYNICVANQIVRGYQQIVAWHVDDIKVRHTSKQGNEEFIRRCKKKYGSALNGHIKVTRGKKHEHLAMLLDHSGKGTLKINMKSYIKDILDIFPESLSENVKCPWASWLFYNSNDSKLLNQQKKGLFHTYVMKCMFLDKRETPDILTGISAFSTRVLTPDEDDWNKLTRLLDYLKTTINIILQLEADDVQNLKWYVDASFGTHSNLKRNTVSVFTLGKGVICNDSSKQKVNARSSTEAELISIGDKISKMTWIKRFIESQGFHINLNIIYQDNASTIKLAENGKYSSGKRT